MDINNTPLLRIVSQQKQIEGISSKQRLLNEIVEYQAEGAEESVIDKLIAENGNKSIYEIANQIAIDGVSAKQTNIKNSGIDNAVRTGLSITVSTLSKAQENKIKQMIYNLHHSSGNGGSGAGGTSGTGGTGSGTGTGGTSGTGGTGSGTGAGGTDDDENGSTTGGTGGTSGTGGTGSGTGTGGTSGTDGTDDDDSGSTTGGTGGTSGTGGTDDESGTRTDDDGDNTNKTSYLDEFDDTDSLFEWLHSQDSSITKDTGITASQLWKLTQKDDWEASHGYFFGLLNKAFTVVDKDNNDILSYQEIKELIGNEIGSFSNYESKVETWAAEIQSKFSTMTLSQKKEFLIEMTRDYFKAAGLTDQTKALDRLIANNKISYANLNAGSSGAGTTLGQYVYYQNTTTGDWVKDDPSDAGMFLDENLAKNPSTTWYLMVQVMVHEITHATAYLYPSDLPRWGEHVAYQVGEDYLDSVSEGYYNGADEKQSIKDHIATYYDAKDVALEPSWKWWSYA